MRTSKDFKSFSEKIIYLVLKSSLMKGKSLGLSASLLRQYEAQAIDTILYKYEELLKLHIDKVYTNQGSYSDKAQLISFYTKILIEEVSLLEYFSYNGKVVLDEGLIHNNEGLVNLEDFSHLINQNSHDYFKPMGIIHCHMSLDDYYLRRKTRIDSGKGLYLDRKLNKSQLMEMCKEDLIKAETKAEIMQKLNVPVLKLDTLDPIQDNSKKISKFIKEL